MEPKKNPEADLEQRKSSFLLLGLLSAMALALVAFEWTQFDDRKSEQAVLDMEFLEEEVIPPSALPPPPPPPPPAPTTILEIVEDDEDVEEVEMEDTEVDEETVVEVIEQPEEEVVEEQIFTIVEQMPAFPGGDSELFKYLGKAIKYPQMAIDAGITGTVYVTFVVDKDGKVKNAKVMRGIGGGCDEEALRVVNAMPAWNPGKQRGKPVKVQYNLPVKFILK